jgi:HSP20 family protein
MYMLVRSPSFLDLDAMDRRFRRVLESIGVTPELVPAADVYETGEQWVVELEVPGYEEKDLALEVSDHTLTVKGTRESVTEETGKTFQLHERLEREFERTFVVPDEVDTNEVTATFSKGVLEVHAPKSTASTSRKIAITS